MKRLKTNTVDVFPGQWNENDPPPHYCTGVDYM